MAVDSGRGRRRCPNGAAVRPGQGNALVDEGQRCAMSTQRANRSPGRTVGPLGRCGFCERSFYQGGALAWENHRAFGPSVDATFGKQQT